MKGERRGREREGVERGARERLKEEDRERGKCFLSRDREKEIGRSRVKLGEREEKREKRRNRERGASGGRVWEAEGGRWRRTARFP